MTIITREQLEKAQNMPHNRKIDVMTWSGMCKTNDELEKHVENCEKIWKRKKAS